MAKPDIYLHDNKARVTAPFEASTDSDVKDDGAPRKSAHDGNWNVRLDPVTAQIQAGGGPGVNNAGAIRLYDGPQDDEAKPVIHASARGDSEVSSTEIYIGGGGSDVDIPKINVGDAISIRAEDSTNDEPAMINVGDFISLKDKAGSDSHPLLEIGGAGYMEGGTITTFPNGTSDVNGSVTTETIVTMSMAVGGFLFAPIFIDGESSDFGIGGGEDPGTVTVRGAQQGDCAVIEGTNTSGDKYAGKITLYGPNNDEAGAIEAEDGALSFTSADGTEALRIESNGDVKVKGGSVDST